MINKLNAEFIISAEKLSQCPDFSLPEFPLLGRSNVGKSSFINALANNKKLAWLCKGFQRGSGKMAEIS